MDFVYIDSAEKLDEFSEFVRGLGVKKIQGAVPEISSLASIHLYFADCWDHKAMPCLIKSQSPMSAEDWDSTLSTTNTAEAQHHWTNRQTGVKLSLVEAIESARKLDERVAREIELSIQSSILVNSHNEAYHRRARNATRHTTTFRKARESHELADERARIELEIEAENRKSAARLKALQTRKSATRKTKSGGAARSEARTVFVSANSSGRVTTRTIGIMSLLFFPRSASTPLREAPPIQPVASTSAASLPMTDYMQEHHAAAMDGGCASLASFDPSQFGVYGPPASSFGEYVPPPILTDLSHLRP
ncbi:hypothetical protein B0H13DRAFT_1868324 [Mycena leptocephala]|nr:hypothetical protein B0H13DRAFT_1868324 [Mycena leptocephala]